MSRLVTLLTIALLTTSCSSTGGYQSVADSFVGYPTDNLLTHGSWGPPLRSQDLSDGRQVWYYEKHTSQSVAIPKATTHTGSISGPTGTYSAQGSSMTTEVHSYASRCGVSFVIDHGVIQQAFADGGGC